MLRSLSSTADNGILLPTFVSLGIFYLINSRWFYKDIILSSYNDTPPYSEIAAAANKIFEDSKGQSLLVRRIGFNDKFENDFANNYVYLLTLKGAKIDLSANLKYTIVEEDMPQETPEGVKIWDEDGIRIFKEAR